MGNAKVMIDANRCVGCGMCAKICAAHNLTMKNRKAEPRAEQCVLCGQCVAICPKNAVSILGDLEAAIEKRSEPRLNPEDVLDTIRYRRTIRRFQQKEVPKEIVERLLEAGRLTHTAKNLQDVSFVVLIREKDRAERIAVKLFRRLKPFANLFSALARNVKIDDNFFFFQAPVVIVILAKDKTNGILAAQNMEFMAEAYGLGVLYSGFFTAAANFSLEIKKILSVPKGKRVAMTLVMGYPDVKFLRSAPRKSPDVKYR